MEHRTIHSPFTLLYKYEWPKGSPNQIWTNVNQIHNGTIKLTMNFTKDLIAMEQVKGVPIQISKYIVIIRNGMYVMRATFVCRTNMYFNSYHFCIRFKTHLTMTMNAFETAHSAVQRSSAIHHTLLFTFWSSEFNL